MDPAIAPTLLLVLAGYAIGSLPVSSLIGRAVGVDVVRQGERNPGASNVWRLAGPGPGLLAAVADVSKGVVPAVLGWVLLGYGGAWIAGLAAIVGAIWPAAGRLPGGRGVAATGGALVALNPGAALVALGGGAATVAVGLLAGRGRRAAATTGLVLAFVIYPLAFLSFDLDPGHLGAAMTLYVVAALRWMATRGRHRDALAGSR